MIPVYFALHMWLNMLKSTHNRLFNELLVDAATVSTYPPATLWARFTNGSIVIEWGT